MNPYDEKKLRDEVIYLHSLWQQGPPRSSNQNPQNRPTPSTQNPVNKRKSLHLGPYPPPKKPDHGLDWSVHVKPTSPSSPGWPEPKSKPNTTLKPVSIEDQAMFASMQMQNKVVESCKHFFKERVRDEESDDDDDDDVDEEEKNEVDMFLMSIFVKNSELRGYYEENHEKGEFFCLVCGGIGESVGKKFKGCVGLVQHCMSISKTKSKIGHRAFGLVVCKVLGWDCDRLPVILLKGEPLSRSLANSRESQNTLKGDGSNTNVDLKTENSDGDVLKEASNSLDKWDDLNVDLGNVESANAVGIGSFEREVSSFDQSNGELMACNMSNNSLKGDDANENVGSLEISDGQPIKGAVNDLGLDSSQITTTGWPCIAPVDESTSTTLEWPSFMPCTVPVTHVFSAEEQIRVDMAQFQVNVFEACKQFLSTTAESDSSEDDEFDEGEDEDGSKAGEEFSFFSRLFTENNELRSYYESNYRGGDFWCLVCRGIGKKDWRTFKDCVGLIQHSTAISKTKRKRAHRAFGEVICKVLNWDIDHLPSIILKSEPQNQSLEGVSQELAIEDHAMFASMQMQNKVVESCKHFFKERVRDEESDDDDDDVDEEEKNEVDMFLMSIFVKNSELRGYYEENHEKGEFFCLVCGGIGESVGKRFKGCVGLVQHCMSISKTKSKIGHRAFGLVVCKVLGWDCDRLPVILLKGEPLSRSLANSRESQNTLKGDGSNTSVDLKTENSDGEVLKEASNSLDKWDDLNVDLGNVESANAVGIGSFEREVSSFDQCNGELMASHLPSIILKSEPQNQSLEGVPQGLDSSQYRTNGWPCIEPVDESTSTTVEWPSFTPCTAPVTHVLTAQDQIRVDKVQFQVNVFEACTQFLSITAESDSGEDYEFDEGEDEDRSKDNEEFDFFLRLFTENNGLRSYYETNCRDGDFWCLVCRGIRKKAWRTFKDCVGLIQHSTSISDTKGKRAHRAFGQVICKVLNWDIAHLPSIILKSEPQSRSSENLSQITTNGWSCIEPVNESTSTILEWPSFTPCTAPVTRVLSAQDQIRVDKAQFQVNVFEACKQFLSTTAESDSGEDDDFDEGEDEDGSEDNEEFDFFLRLFTENNGLRNYYETNCRNGEFWCLVCRGIRKKAWRTFKDCVGLIQHSTSISNTKGKRAHRAFGQVICKVLNWDMDHLPSNILKSEPQNRSSEDTSQFQNDGKAVCDGDGSDAPMSKTDSESGLKEDVDAHQNNSLVMGSENALNETVI